MQEVSRSGITGELQLSALIADLWWRVDLLNSDILEEEAKSGLFDVRQPNLRAHATTSYRRSAFLTDVRGRRKRQRDRRRRRRTVLLLRIADVESA